MMRRVSNLSALSYGPNPTSLDEIPRLIPRRPSAYRNQPIVILYSVLLSLFPASGVEQH